jgi:multiple sugar transport system permease protein
LVWFSAFMLWPLANMFYLSMFDWDNLISPKRFVGLANFETLLRDDPHFVQALRNSAIQISVSVLLVVTLGFMLGFFLSQRRLGYRVLRVTFFLPSLVSATALAIIFAGVYLPDGVVNSALRSFGAGGFTRSWLGDPSTVLASLIAIDFWAGIGFWAVLFSAILLTVPDDVYEAARLDGARPWTVMWQVAFPLSMNFFGVALILQFVWILLGSAQNVLLLTKGGPGDSSLTLGYYLYDQGFQSAGLGYSQAIGVFIFFTGIIGMLAIWLATRRAF